MPPPPWQPPLNRWSSGWRYVLCLAISAIGWSTALPGQWDGMRWLVGLDLVLGAAAYALVTQRRRWPLAVAVATTVLSAGSGIAAGPATFATVSLATHRRVVRIVAVGALGIVASQTWTVTQPLSSTDPYWLSLTVNLVFVTAVLAWGMYIGSRRELLWTLRERAERAEAEQELRSGKARTDERARIAREMHDVLAHRISQVSMHAGALAFREDLSATEMRSTAGVIQAQSNEALTELRAVLGVLRDTDTGALLDAPQPTYDDLAALVTAARENGMRVEYDAAVDDAGEVPVAVGRTVYRIVQEGLTNARKHAPGATVRVVVSGSPGGGIDVSLRNRIGFGAPAPPGAGLGLLGLRERADLRGGRLEHRREGPWFVLQGWIPWAP